MSDYSGSQIGFSFRMVSAEEKCFGWTVDWPPAMALFLIGLQQN